MDPILTLGIIIAYFLVLFVISFITGKGADQNTFFTANRNSPWYLVAFGMVGASLSGVTFISVPGAVGGGAGFGYFQFVLGNFIGYIIMAQVLLPLYYRLNLTSIYGYLEQRFGFYSYKTGSVLFLLSRIIGASLRMYLVALVIQLAIGEYFGIPFWLTVLVSIALIYLYTFRGGIKTVVWTDTLQTFCMLLAAGITVWVISDSLGSEGESVFNMLVDSPYTRTFTWGGPFSANFFTQIVSGALITLVMTGLDQDMMQKNLTCKNLGEAQKNVYWFSSVFVFANLLFLSLGALLYLFGLDQEIIREEMVEGKFQLLIQDIPTKEWIPRRTDELFPSIALSYLGPAAGIAFVLGVIAAAYSSADSALTALTTSFCVDILGFEKTPPSPQKTQTRFQVHMAFALTLFLVILIFNWLNDRAVVYDIFTAAGYTYGPLLGMYAFGLYTNFQVKDKLVPWVCIICPILSYLIDYLYSLGFFIIMVNGLLCFAGMYLVRERG
ncbi:MAG: sodium:solute symporter [Bacteroidota bacterium]